MELPLEVLPDPYYNPWEAIVANLQALLLSKRLRAVIRNTPVLSTSRLQNLAEWRRAYVLLSFMAHAYIWGGDVPEEVYSMKSCCLQPADLSTRESHLPLQSHTSRSAKFLSCRL